MNKTIAFRFLFKLMALSIVLVVAIHFLHRRQIGKQTQAFLELADNAEKKGELTRMVTFLTRYLSFRPNDATARARKGFALARAAKKPDEWLQALLELERALRDDPTREDVRRKNVRLSMALGQVPEALAHIEVLLALYPDDAELFDLKGQCTAAMGDFSKAEELFGKAISLKPMLIQTYARRAVVLRLQLKRILDEGDVKGADSVIEDLVKANGKVAEAHLIRANYWNQFGNIIEAEKSIAIAQTLSPDDPEVLFTAANFAFNRGERLRQTFKFDEMKKEIEIARELLQRGIDKNPPPELAPDKAEDEYESLVSKRAIVVELYKALVSLEKRTGRLAEAEKLAVRGVELFHDLAELVVNLVDVLILQAKDESIREAKIAEAEANIKKLADANYLPAILDYHRARILVLQERWLEASIALNRAAPELAGLPAQSRQAYFLLGQCFDRMGEIDRRYKAFLDSRPTDTLDPLWISASVAVASSLAEMGRSQEAIKDYYLVVPLYRPAAIPLARLLLIDTVRQSANEPREKWDWSRVDAVVKVAPESLEKSLVEADVFMAKGLMTEAKRTLDLVKEKYDKEIDLWVAFAVHAFVLKDFGRAEQLLKDAEAKFGDRVEIRLARARFLSAPLTPESAKQLSALAEVGDRFTAADRRRLLRGLCERAQELGDRDLAGNLWNRLAVEQPDNLGVQFRRFDRAIQIEGEPAIRRAAIEQVIADIQRIDGKEGTSTRMARAMYLIWKARHDDKSGLDEARDLLADLQQKRSGWPRIPVALAVVYELKGDPDAAMPQYQAAVDLGEKDPEVIGRLAELYYGKQRFNEADVLLKSLPEGLAGKEGLQVIAAEIALGSNNKTRALEMAEKAVGADSKDYKKQLWLGRVRWLSGLQAEAEAPFRKAVELENTVPDTWIALLQYLAGMDRKPEAEKLLDDARQRVKKEDTSRTLAAGYEILGRPNEAREWFKKALVERPDHIPTLRGAANFQLRQARDKTELEPVQKLLDRILQLKSKTREDTQFASRLLGIVLAMDPDYEKSHRALEMMGLLDGGFVTPTASMSLEDIRARAVALSFMRTRRPIQESIKLFEQIDARRPLSSDDQFLLAQLLNILGEKAGAQRRLARLVQSDANNALYVAYYTVFLIRNEKSTAEARKWLAVLQKIQPDVFRTTELRFRLLRAEGKKPEAINGLLTYVNERLEMTVPIGLAVGSAGLAPIRARSLEGLLGAARLAEEFKEIRQAEAFYRRVVAESKEPAARLALAEFHARQNRNRDALDLLEVDAKSYPTATLASVALGILYTVDQPSPEDIRRVRALLENNKPKGSETPLYDAALKNLEGDYGGAIALYRRMLERDPKNILAMNNLAFLLAFHERKHSEALEVIRNAKAHSKPEAAILDTEATILISNGQPQDAIELLQDALVVAPTRGSYFHLAQAYSLLGNNVDAADALARAKKLGLRISDVHPLERPAYEKLLQQFPND